MKTIVPILLAAGEGKRMRSTLPKVLHQVGGKPMIRRVMEAAALPGAEPPVVVVGHRAGELQAALGQTARYALQREQLGTGHAVMCAEGFLKAPTGAPKEGCALVVAGDMPLLTQKTLQALVDEQQKTGAALVFLSAVLKDPTGYGRVVRDEQGRLKGIVEQKDATEKERAICEVNTLVYCLDIPRLLWALRQLTTENAQNEYYLTDCVKLFVDHNMGVEALPAADPDECLGVNTPEELAHCDAICRARGERG